MLLKFSLKLSLLLASRMPWSPQSLYISDLFIISRLYRPLQWPKSPVRSDPCRLCSQDEMLPSPLPGLGFRVPHQECSYPRNLHGAISVSPPGLSLILHFWHVLPQPHYLKTKLSSHNCHPPLAFFFPKLVTTPWHTLCKAMSNNLVN